MDVAERGVGIGVEADLKLAAAGGDVERAAGVCGDGSSYCCGCDARSAGESLGLDTTLVGTDGDVGIGDDVDEIDIYAIGGEAL